MVIVYNLHIGIEASSTNAIMQWSLLKVYACISHRGKQFVYYIHIQTYEHNMKHNPALVSQHGRGMIWLSHQS